MTTKHHIAMAAALLAMATTAGAQTLNSAYFTTDYKYRHDMNPAFGNEQNYISTSVLGNINVQLRGNFGLQDVLFDNPLYTADGSQKRYTTFLNPYISTSEALSGFSSGSNRIMADIGISLMSAGFKSFGGYSTIEINSRTMVGLSLPYELFAFAKNTGNQSYDIGDISMRAMSFAELAVGHSRQINERLRVGAKVKLLFGLARADLQLQDIKADLTGTDKWTLSGRGEAQVSIKGFEYVSEEEDYYDEDRGSYEQVDDVDVDGFGLGGFGMAFDLGGEYKIDDDWTVSAAILDLGFIHWSSNARAVNTGEAFEFNGFRDIDVNGGDNEFSDIADNYGDQFTDFAHLEAQEDGGGRTTGIGATLNLGATYNLPVYRPITFGLLSSTKINGPYSWTEARLSANYNPLKWLNGGVNMSVGSFGTSFGWVLNIHPKGYNIFLGMDHILGKLSKDFIPVSSKASINLGMNIAW